MILGQLKIGERLATCEALQMTFSGGPYPLFLSFYDQQRELVFAIQKFFLFHLFKYPFALSAIRLFSGTWVGLFQPSVCSGDLSVAISLSSNLELEPTSTSATCLHGSYFMSTRKTAFWIQERILFQFLKKAQLVLLSVYPTYPFTFYVNRTKRHVTWSICLSTKEWHFVFSGTQYSRDSSSSWSWSLSSPLSIWRLSCSSRYRNTTFLMYSFK